MVVGFHPTWVFRLAVDILESIEVMPSLHLAQVVAMMAHFNDSFKLAILQAKLIDEAQLAIIGKLFAYVLGLMSSNLEPCPFIILGA